VGYEAGTQVAANGSPRRFSGAVNWVQLDLGADAHDHLVDPEHVLRVAMSLQ
jgi:arylsulfatase